MIRTAQPALTQLPVQGTASCGLRGSAAAARPSTRELDTPTGTKCKQRLAATLGQALGGEQRRPLAQRRRTPRPRFRSFQASPAAHPMWR